LHPIFVDLTKFTKQPLKWFWLKKKTVTPVACYEDLTEGSLHGKDGKASICRSACEYNMAMVKLDCVC